MTQWEPGSYVPEFTMGDRCRKAREYAGLSQDTLASEIDVSRQTITNYELGHVSPRRGTLRLWAMRCGVSFEWLATGHVSRGPEPDLGLIVRRQGLEPRTRWLSAANVIRLWPHSVPGERAA